MISLISLACLVVIGSASVRAEPPAATGWGDSPAASSNYGVPPLPPVQQPSSEYGVAQCVPEIRTVVQTVDRPVVQVQTVYKDRVVPVDRVVYRDRIVEKPVTVQVPVDRVVYRDRIVEKPVTVQVPVDRVVYKDRVIYKDRIIDRPVVQVQEKIVRVPYPVEKVVVRDRPYPVVQERVVKVQVPVDRIVEKRVIVKEPCVSGGYA